MKHRVDKKGLKKLYTVPSILCVV